MHATAPSITNVGEIPALKHVAIIMDGNGRWAKARGTRRAVGHQKGSEAVRQAVEGALDNGVKYLTLYAFSSENWNRPDEEVSGLMGLLKIYLSKEVEALHKEDVRLRVIGNRERLSSDIIEMIDKAEAKTKNNTDLTVVIALSYGAREEIVKAARNIATMVKSSDLQPSDVDETLFESNLQTHDIPDPDLIIRTSGEQRLSNFLLWQAAYSEFLFLDTLWPDFTKDDFSAAVREFRCRDRRYGLRK